jgi:hypothetical protein
MDRNGLGRLATVAAILVGFWLGLSGQSETSGSSIGIQQSGTPSGAAGVLNCSTNMTCSVSNGVVSISSTASGGGPSANQNIRSIGAGFSGGGSALTTGAVAYVTAPPACTIAAYNITIDTGTISFDVWKVATGTTIPTVSNTILTGGYLSISSGTAIHSSSTALFTTTTSAANDIYGFEVEAVSGATVASIVLQCNATT